MAVGAARLHRSRRRGRVLHGWRQRHGPCSRPRVHAASINYGPPPAHPEQALAAACPIVASYGRKDRSLRGAADRLDRALAAHGIDHKEYPEAGHGFINDHRDEHIPFAFALAARFIGGADYHEPSAPDARRRIVAFFDRHLREPAS